MTDANLGQGLHNADLCDPLRTMNKRYLPYWITFGVLVATAAILLWMGRIPMCKCGYIKLLHLETISSENSQHIADWYTPSHLLHGFIFYFGLWLFARRIDIGWRLAIATVIEAAWEILENTDAVINRYREVTIALDYYGDSVLNSVFDIIAMWVGFWLARRLPVWVSVAIVILAEVIVMAAIRDGLALNIIMLLYPLDAIREWQAAG
jgi:hypothetical protein